MKWIKTAVGAVIAVSVVPLLVLTIININKSLDSNVVDITITDSYNDEIEPITIFTDNNSIEFVFNSVSVYITNTYDSIYSVNPEKLSSLDITFISPELEKIIITIEVSYDEDRGGYYSYMTSDIPYNDISSYIDNDYNITNLSLSFKSNNIKNINIITTILSFAPIIFVSGVLFYFYKPFKRRD